LKGEREKEVRTDRGWVGYRKQDAQNEKMERRGSREGGGEGEAGGRGGRRLHGSLYVLYITLLGVKMIPSSLESVHKGPLLKKTAGAGSVSHSHGRYYFHKDWTCQKVRKSHGVSTIRRERKKGIYKGGDFFVLF